MTLTRVLEPEVMETESEAADYDAMDHAAVNQAFVDDLLAAGEWQGDVLDLGTGTALIPVELCRRVEECRVMAVDLSIAMLDLARFNIEVAGMIERIQLDHIDGKNLPYEDGSFAVVMSNSIVHHIPEPLAALREAVRVTRPGGLVFFRDLSRPVDEATLEHLVETYAGEDNDSQKKMFSDSLRAALTVDELRDLLGEIDAGLVGDVAATSDRHWTWCSRLRA